MNATWQDGSGGGPQLAFPSITPVVKKLLILNVAVFVGMFLLDIANQGIANGVIELLALNPRQWFVGPPWFPFWQPLTYGFLHDLSGLGHVFWNMLQLYFFGTMLEGILGSRRFLFVYGCALVVGAFLHLLLQPLTGHGILPG